MQNGLFNITEEQQSLVAVSYTHLDVYKRQVYDRGEGKGAKINVDIIAKDGAGEPVFTNTMGYLNRWAGGFGGPKVPHSSVVIPEREADYQIKDAYPENVPLLYRLTGDTLSLIHI